MPTRTRDDPHAEEIVRATKESYATITTREKARRSAAGVLHRIGKLFLKWDAEFSRPNKRAANAVEQLCGVELSLQHSHEMLARSLRDAIRAAIVEQADADYRAFDAKMEEEPNPKENPIAELELHQQARAVLMAALRTDAGEEDIARVMRAIKKALEHVQSGVMSGARARVNDLIRLHEGSDIRPLPAA